MNRIYGALLAGLLALVFCANSSPVSAQCSGLLQPGAICGNPTTAAAPARGAAPLAFGAGGSVTIAPVAPDGSSWNIFYPDGSLHSTSTAVGLATNSTTAVGNPTLHFASVPSTVVAGMGVVNATNQTTIKAGTTVLSTTATTVTLSNNVLNTTVQNGDQFYFITNPDAVYTAVTYASDGGYPLYCRGQGAGATGSSQKTAVYAYNGPIKFSSTLFNTVDLSGCQFYVNSTGNNASFTGSISGTTLTRTAGTAPSVGMIVQGSGVADDTIITAASDPTYTVSISQTIGSEAMVGYTASGFQIDSTELPPTWRGPAILATAGDGPSILFAGLTLTPADTQSNTQASNIYIPSVVHQYGSQTVACVVQISLSTGGFSKNTIGIGEVFNRQNAGTYGNYLLCIADPMNGNYHMGNTYNIEIAHGFTNIGLMNGNFATCNNSTHNIGNTFNVGYLGPRALDGSANATGVFECGKENKWNGYIDSSDISTGTFLRPYDLGTTSLYNEMRLNYGGPAAYANPPRDQGVGNLRYFNGAQTYVNLWDASLASTFQLFANGAGAVTFPTGTTDFSTTGGTHRFLKQNSTGAAITVVQPACTDLSDAGVGCSAAGSALTKTDDTNVTLTLGGSPTTALLAATSITAGWTGQLAVSRGGTGQSTLTNHGVLVGAGTSAITQLAAASTGTVLAGSTGADPAFTGSPSLSSLTLSGALNKVTITPPASGSTLTVDDGITLRASTTSVIKPPSITVLTSGTDATYNTPAGATWLRIRMVGGGAGGAGGGSGSPGDGTAGNNTCWKASGTACTSPLYESFGGSVRAGTGGGTSGCDVGISGGVGGVTTIVNGAGGHVGGPGGVSAFGGNSNGVNNGTGSAPGTNSGSGGAGGGGTDDAVKGEGGSAGGYCEKIVTAPLSSYVYTVASTAAGGAAGTNGQTGTAGAAGIIIVEAHYH